MAGDEGGRQQEHEDRLVEQEELALFPQEPDEVHLPAGADSGLQASLGPDGEGLLGGLFEVIAVVPNLDEDRHVLDIHAQRVERHADEGQEHRCDTSRLQVGGVGQRHEPEKHLDLVRDLVEVLAEPRGLAPKLRHLTIHAVEDVTELDQTRREEEVRRSAQNDQRRGADRGHQ